MALHNSFKQGQSQQSDNRLACVPNADELNGALSQARKSGKRPVVLSWKSQKSNSVFWLSVTASGAGNEADWLLQKGAEGTQPKDVWNHKTTDTTLIQSLISAEEEIAFKSGSRAIIPPNNAASENPNQPYEPNGNDDPWSKASTTPGGAIVLGGGTFQTQAQRPQQQSSQGWPASEVSGWNTPQPNPEQLGWVQKSTPPAETSGSNSNPFAALKGTVEEPKPVNPFNSLMSNQSLPQIPPQKLPGNLPEKKLEPQSQSQTSGQSLPPNNSQNGGQKPDQSSGQFAAQPQRTSSSQIPAQNQRTSSSKLPVQNPSKFVDEADEVSSNPYDALTNSGQGIKAAPKPAQAPPAAPAQTPARQNKPDSPSGSFPQQTPSGKVHPPVPNFAAMTSSGSYPVVSVPPEQALNPKVSGKPMAVNQISGPPGQNQRTTLKNAPAIVPSSQALTNNAKALPAPINLDRAAVDGVFKTLSNPETGLLNHGSMLFFLVREFSRFQVNDEPFSLIIMQMNVLISGSTGAFVQRPLPPRAVRGAAQKVIAVARQLDLVSHYEENDYAILLPATNRKQAGEFAQTVAKVLLSQPLTPDMDPKALILRMGVASFPEDTSHPGILLAAAAEAKDAAVKANKPIVLFAET
ncbi:MAG: hypothetical protein K2Y39_13930 [Candidatus Obscuribacterales bacterium]|nr:hypothetical protein [Candidatus Obscuribacterales bacterium]